MPQSRHRRRRGVAECAIPPVGNLTPGVEYVPSPPKSSVLKRFKGPGIVKLNGNEVADVFPDYSYLFTEGICGLCKRGRGDRTKFPLRFEIHGVRGADGIFVRFQSRGPYGIMRFSVFSQEFIDSLGEEETSGVEWIPVEVTNKSKKKYFERFSKPLASQIMPAGLFIESERLQEDGFLCEECGRTELVGIPQGGGGISTFISAGVLCRTNCLRASKWGRLQCLSSACLKVGGNKYSASRGRKEWCPVRSEL
jgi:hypothetical protein